MFCFRETVSIFRDDVNLLVAGIEFEVKKKYVGGSVYSLWSRELLATIELLLDRVGKHLDIPRILEEGADISEFWHAGAYQRQLRQFVSRGGNLEEDLLLPLVFFSGAYRMLAILAEFAWHVVSLLVLFVAWHRCAFWTNALSRSCMQMKPPSRASIQPRTKLQRTQC